MHGGAAALLLAAALAAGCAMGDGREQQPELNLDPASAIQGAVLVINAGAEGVDFDKCANLAAPADALESVVFHPPADSGAGAGEGVTVYFVQPVGAQLLRVEIAVSADAPVGDYLVEIACGSAAPLRGSFRVRERKDEPVLDLSPDSAAAGITNLPVDILVTGAELFPDACNVTFGTGAHVAVKQQVLKSATEMAVVIDIGPGAPLGPMEVTVSSGGLVARGTFEIEERIYPAVQAVPDHVYRPAGADPPTQATLTVLGSGVNFLAGDPDDEDALETLVTFPLNPGIAVTSTAVNAADTLTVNITVDHLALLGPTPLVVTTGEETAVTDFTVLVTPDTPVLAIQPAEIVRGAEPSLFLLQAVNFAFEEPLTVSFVPPSDGCRVEEFQVLSSPGPPQAMAVTIGVDAGFTAASAVLEVTSGGQAVSVHLSVRDPVGVLLAAPNPPSLVQGGTPVIPNVWLGFQDAGSFSPEAHAEVLPRSGLRILSQSRTDEGANLALQVAVAPDAPLGPASLRVVDGGEVRKTFVRIEPSGSVPSVTLTPNLVLPGRRTAVFQAEAEGLDFSAGPVTVAFDDPGLVLSSIEVDESDARRVTLAVEVLPIAGEDVAVVYFADGGGASAAASLRRLPSPAGVAAAFPDTVQRAIGGEQVVEVTLQGGSFGSTVAQILDDIGVDVRRVTVHSPAALDLVLELEPAGPGGWIGVLLKTGSSQVVVPLRIQGDDESLTLQLQPAQSHPGASGEPLVASAPPGYASLDPIFTVASAGREGAHAVVSEVLSGQQANLLLDIAHDLIEEPGGVPVLLTATKGAYAGFVSVPPLSTGAAGPQAPWQDTLSAGESRLISVDPGAPPAVALPRVGDPGHADSQAALIDGGGLAAVAGVPPHGLTWVTGGGGALMAIEPLGVTGGMPSLLQVRGMGDGAIELFEPDDTPALATPVGDPCAAPVLAVGAIDQGLDVDRVALDEAPCDLAAVIIARSLAPRPWHTSQCRLERRDAADAPLDSAAGTPLGDPRLYLSGAQQGEQLVIGGELGAAGAYLLNIRRAAVIGEICLGPEAPFVELSVLPGMALEGLTVELVDGDSGMLLEALALTGQVAGDTGVFVIGGASMSGADLNHPVAELPDAGSFALRLLVDGELSDAVQVGGDGSYGEGEPLARADGRCFFRPGTIDTDRNRADFLPVWAGTPGFE